MSLRELLGPVAAALVGRQRKATIVLLVSPILILSWKYFGSPEYYLDHFDGDRARLEAQVSSGGKAPAAKAELRPSSPASQFRAAFYSFGACFVLMGLVPALVVKLVFRERLADYGVQLGIRRRTFRSFLMIAPVILLIAYLSRTSPAILQEYPINRSAGASPGMFALHALTYLTFYLGWEFHFRGFLQFGLRGQLGAANALLVQVMASSLLHIGKPSAETFAAILAGILWGLLAYRTRSLLSGFLQHALLGISLDGFICLLEN